MKKQNYRKTLPREMYTYFSTYDDQTGAPSFRKFAALVGMTVEELCSLRRHKKFDKSYRECSEIRRDYLIDHALCRRFDPSFVKFLISDENEAVGTEDIEIKFEVVE